VPIESRNPVSQGGDHSWEAPPPLLTLNDAEVHIWRASLVQPSETLASYSKMLAPDEHQRAGRFIFERDRQRFFVARGMLRLLLGRYLERDPDTVRFSYSEYGKPEIAEPAKSDLRFNVSHSHELVLYAFTRKRQIGVDVEYVNPDRAVQDIAARFFSEREIAMLRSLPQTQQTEAFFACWTRKEAYIKGRGQGLSFPLTQFDVSLIPGTPVELLECREPANARTERWSLGEIGAGVDYAAAMAVEGDKNWTVRCWQWEG
jgi:4'-phosphopantetheinyl transferase